MEIARIAPSRTPADTDLEHAARALAHAQLTRNYADLARLKEAGVLGAGIEIDRAWPVFVPETLAAILALRDPTAGLVEAMTDALIRGHLIEVQGSGLEAAVRKHTAERRDTYRDFVRCAWIVGIDHITQQRAAGQEAPETNG